jgi:hypothetical protein
MSSYLLMTKTEPSFLGLCPPSWRYSRPSEGRHLIFPLDRGMPLVGGFCNWTLSGGNWELKMEPVLSLAGGHALLVFPCELIS